MKLRLTLLICLLLPLFHAFAASLTEQRQAIEQDLMNLRLNRAEERTLSLPVHWQAFYLAHIAAYRYICTQSPAYIKTFRIHADEAMTAISALPSEDPEKRLLMAELEGKRAALEFADGNPIAALWRIRACHDAISANTRLFPKYAENNKILGIFNVVFSAVPSKFHWISSSLGFEGDLKKGLEQLDYAMTNGTLLKYETYFISYHVDKNLLARPEQATSRIKGERDRMGPGIVLDFMLAGSYLGQKKNEEALAILSKREKYASSTDIFYINYWDYFLGKAYYYCGRYDAAQQAFTRFLTTHKGNIYRTDAMFRLGMCYVLTNNYAEGRKKFRQLLDTQPSAWDEDEYANHMATKFANRAPSGYEVQLFSTRNLYDGGYNTEARDQLLDLMRHHSSLTPMEKTEFHYRLGRVYESLNDRKQAMLHYGYCTQQPPGDDGRVQRYLKAYSFYYMAELNRAMSNTAAARANYQQALGFKDFFYQAGLESKCKAALKQVK